MAQPTYQFDNYRFYDDDANEASATALGTGNNQALDMDVGTSGRVQVRIEGYNNNNKAATEAFSWEFNIDSAGWTTLDGSSDVRIYASSYNTHDEDVTQRLTSNSTYDTTNAGCINSTSDPVTSSPIDASNYFELVATIYLVDGQFTGGESIQLRIVEGSGDTCTMNVNPTINVNTPPLVITPSAASCIGGRVNPTVVLGSTTATPTPASAIGRKVNPTVIDQPTGLNQAHFRFRDDNYGINVDNGWLAALDTSPTSLDMGQQFRLRVEIVENEGVDVTDGYKLQVKVNAGSWNDCGTQSGATNTAVIVTNSYQYADQAATTDLLSGSSETFTAGEGLYDDNLTGSVTLNNQHTEFEWALLTLKNYDSFNALQDADTIYLRVVRDDGTVLDNYEEISYTVNEPDGFIGGTFVESPQSMGPIKDGNGNLYFFGEHSSQTTPTNNNTVSAWKSTDNGVTWAEVDGANRPTKSDFEAGDLQIVGDTVYIVHHSGSAGIRLHIFNMSSASSNADTWTTTDEVVDSSTPETDQAVALAVLSDGDMWCFYRTTVSTYESIVYKRRTSGSWGSRNTLDSESSTNFTWVTCVVGESNLTHVFYQEISNGSGNMYHRSLSSGGTLSGRESISAASGTNGNNSKGIAKPIYFDDAGDEIILVVYRESDNDAWSRTITNDGTPSSATGPINTYAMSRAEGGSAMLSAQMVGDGQGNAWLIYAENVNLNLYLLEYVYGTGWGSDILLSSEAHNFQQVGYWKKSNGELTLGYVVESHPYYTTVGSYGDDGLMWYDEYITGLEITPTPVSAVTGKVDPTVIGGGGVTVEPAAVSCIAGKADPTVVKGSITVYPTAVNAIAGNVDPTIIHGSLTISSTAIHTIGNKADPTVILGSFSITPASGGAVCGKVDPTVVLGSTTATPAPVSSIATKVDPTVVQSSLILAPTPSFSIANKVDPEVVLGDTTATPAVVSAIAGKTDPTVVEGSLSLTPSPATSVSGSVNPTVVQGSLSLAPSAVNAVTSSQIGTVLGGGVSVAPTPVSVIAGKVDPTVVLGSTSATPSPIFAVAGKADPTVIMGSLVLTSSPASAITGKVDPSVIHGSITITPTPASDVGRKVDPTVVLGSTTATPSPASAVTRKADPTVLGGGEVIAPNPASAIAGKVDPTVELGSTSATPSPVFAIAGKADPTVELGSLTITPSTIFAVTSSAGPVVQISDLGIIPTPASCIAGGVDPSVVHGSVSVTATVSSIALSVDPAVVLGSTTATPPQSYAVAGGADPIVQRGSLSVTPQPIFALTNGADPSTILGSLAISSAPAEAIARKLDPSILFGSLTFSPDPATALAQAVLLGIVISGTWVDEVRADLFVTTSVSDDLLITDEISHDVFITQEVDNELYLD